MDTSDKLMKIILENVKKLENISMNDLMTVAVKSFHAGKDISKQEFVKDLEKLESKLIKF